MGIMAVSEDLHARARAWVDAFEADAPMPERFDALACDLARFQAAHVPGFARLLAARGLAPSALAQADDIPAVPTDAFKLTRVATFPPEEARSVFRTSGTTVGARGTHELRDPATYDRAAVAFGRRWLARDLEAKVPVVVLAPPPGAEDASSLVHMCARFVDAFGSRSAFVIDSEGIFDLSTFDEIVSYALTNDEPVLVLGTSFAFVHFLDAIGDDIFRLPAKSRVMQTGGYKGRSREVPKAELRAKLARAFGLGERAIVAEYGMTELSSQFYERTLFDPAAPADVFAEPPWARVVPVDPDTLEPVKDGEVGIAKIVDLANVDSAVAVLTQDEVRRVEGGFALLGRASGAPPRGCSIAIDELLGRT